MKTRHLLTAAVAITMATGCRGKLITKAELRAPGTAEARFRAGGKVRLWANLDGKWKGPSKSYMPIRYDIEVRQGGKAVGRLSCDTSSTSTSVCGSHTNINGNHDADCEVKLACELPALAAGEVVLRVTGRPGDPSRVTLIRDMSVHVREE